MIDLIFLLITICLSLVNSGDFTNVFLLGFAFVLGFSYREGLIK